MKLDVSKATEVGAWIGHRAEDVSGNSVEVKGNVVIWGKLRLAH